MRQTGSESVEDFLSMFEMQTFKSKLADELHVQIAWNGLNQSISSAISINASKTLADVRSLAWRITDV